MDIAKELTKMIRTHLENNPITLDTECLIDFLFQHYSEFVRVSTETTMEKYREVAFAVLDLIRDRDEARGVESYITWDEKIGFPYNEDLEKVMSFVGDLETAYGDDAFRTGFEAGARIVFEIYGERVGITDPD